MKRRIFTLILSVAFIISACAFTLPASADESYEMPRIPESEFPVVTEYNADTFYYDRIPEASKAVYNYLKECYKTVEYDEKTDFYDYLYHTIYMDDAFPEYIDQYGWTEISYLEWTLADMALKLDDPSYEIEGQLGSISREALGFLPPPFEYNEELFYASIKKIVDAVGEGDRYTKLRRLTNYFMDNVYYDPYLGGTDYILDNNVCNGRLAYDVSAYGAIVKGVAICDGMSKAVKLLCNELDIPCIIMGNYAHAWNRIQMDDGQWYDFDLTIICNIGYGEEDRWPGEALYENGEFLTNNNVYNNLHMLAINGVKYITDFPSNADCPYQYAGDETDFSYTKIELEQMPQKYSYRVQEDGRTCWITNYVGNQSGDLIIPETIDGYTVTGIGKYAFYANAGFDGKLVIPSTVRTIDEGAFISCYNLKSVELPYSVEYIGQGAFIGCKSLADIVFPNSSLEISDYAFYDCDSLKSVSFGAHVEFVDDTAFDQIYGNVVFNAPDETYIERYAVKNGFDFVSTGAACSFSSEGGKYFYDDGSEYHYQLCECGARMYEEHVIPSTEKFEYYGCVNLNCEVCGAVYCYTNGFIHPEDISISDELFYENGEEYHYRLCGCGLPIYEKHVTMPTEEYTYYGCGNLTCLICGAAYCYTEGFIRPEDFVFTEIPPNPGDCQTGSFEGAIMCQCGQPSSGGGYTNIKGDHILASDEWFYDENGHYQLCIYGCRLKEGKHYGGKATATELAKCYICGAEYGDFANETPTTEIDTEDITEVQTEPVTEPRSEEITTALDNSGGDFVNASGCGGALGVGYILVVIIPTLGVTVIRKKRRNK